jgi:hypothetical protein
MSRMSRIASPVLVVVVAVVAACNSGTPEKAHVRIANFVPDAPTAIDFCLKPDTDSAFTTPQVGGSGLSFPSLSARSDVDAGTYSVRIVQAGATNCNTTFNGLGDISPIVFGEGGNYTLATLGRVTGTGSPSIGLKPFPDDVSAPASGSKLRYVHAAPSTPTLDVGTISVDTFTPVVLGLDYGQTSNPAYTALTGSGSAEFGVRDSSTQLVLASGVSPTISTGSVDTLWIVGIQGQSGDQRLSFLLCADNAVNCQRFPSN